MRKILDKIARKIYYKEKAKDLTFAAIYLYCRLEGEK